jgi:hypothetical protein
MIALVAFEIKSFSSPFHLRHLFYRSFRAIHASQVATFLFLASISYPLPSSFGATIFILFALHGVYVASTFPLLSFRATIPVNSTSPFSRFHASSLSCLIFSAEQRYSPFFVFTCIDAVLPHLNHFHAQRIRVSEVVSLPSFSCHFTHSPLSEQSVPVK